MSQIETIQSIDTFVAKQLHYAEDQYEAKKIEQLLDAYREQLVSEVKIDAILADINAGSYACSV